MFTLHFSHVHVQPEDLSAVAHSDLLKVSPVLYVPFFVCPYLQRDWPSLRSVSIGGVTLD